MVPMQFYVSSEDDVRRCQESRALKLAITISGTADDGKIRAFTGVVQSIDDDKTRTASKRWRVTMR